MSHEKRAIPDDLLQLSQQLAECAKRTSAAIAAAGADVGGGGGDGTAAWTAPHGEGAAHGLHAVEGAVAGNSAAAPRGEWGVSGTVDRARNGADGVCSGVGVRPRQNARCDERSRAGLG